MTTEAKSDTEEPELEALTTVYEALKGLSREAQERIVDYVVRKLGLASRTGSDGSSRSPTARPESSGTPESRDDRKEEMEDGFDGISPIAQKWIKRNSLDVDQLTRLFSLGADEIDLVAKTVPGDSKNARTRSVALLKAIAAYLSTGAARVSHDQLKEACLHYNAYDSPNHAKYLRGLTSELSGSKETGYTLTARGLTSATEMIRELVSQETNNK